MDILLRSELLDAHEFKHGFSLRTGGVSEGPFESLNLGRTVGDAPERVSENVSRFVHAVGADQARFFEVSQVHKADLVRVGADDEVSAVRKREADAIWIGQPGDAAAVRTADCVPILFADPQTGHAAAAHAGWRGVVAGVVKTTVRAFEPGSAARLLAVIGPHIRVEAFEVGEEVADQLQAQAPDVEVVRRSSPDARPHVDLSAVVRSQLATLGVTTDRIDDVGGCTHREPDRFFSHRRDQGKTGRHLSAIVAR